MHPLRSLPSMPPSPEERDRNTQESTNSLKSVDSSRRKYFDKGVVDDYDGSDENSGDPPEVKRMKRIEKEIEKLRKKYPNKSRVELQNMMAQKYQNSNWYRSGFTYYSKGGESLAQVKSKATGMRNQTILVIALYQTLTPSDFVIIEGGKGEFPFNEKKPKSFLKSPSKFEEGSLEGTIDVFFDDLGIPDRLEIEFDGGENIIFNYGRPFDDTDNKQEKKGIDCSVLKTSIMNITVKNTSTSAANSDFELKIIPDNVTAKLKTPALRSEFITLESLHGTKRR